MTVLHKPFIYLEVVQGITITTNCNKLWVIGFHYLLIIKSPLLLIALTS